jgi:signal transduction histidine kinase
VDTKVQKIFSYIISFSWLSTLAFVYFSNKQGNWSITAFLILVAFTSNIRCFLLYSITKLKKFSIIFLILDFLIIYYINFHDITKYSQVCYFIIAAEMLIFWFSRYIIWAVFIGYASLIATMILKYTRWNYFDFWYLAPNTLEISFYFIFIIGIIYLAVYQSNQSQILKKTWNELKIKTAQLQDTNNKLQETMDALEEVTLLKERNRIAREIHDTVGHTLTTVLIEIEAGKRLIQKDSHLAVAKLELAQEQVRKGLQDIRSSVRLLKEGGNILDFISSIQLLLNETEKHAGVKINRILPQNLPGIPSEKEKVLYRALQEGLTNGIKHGNCTEFNFELSILNNRIIFCLTDNGKGCENIVLGFGLSSMKERVKELDGSFKIDGNVGSGCCLTLEIGIEGGYSNETDKNTDS